VLPPSLRTTLQGHLEIPQQDLVSNMWRCTASVGGGQALIYICDWMNEPDKSGPCNPMEPAWPSSWCKCPLVAEGSWTYAQEAEFKHECEHGLGQTASGCMAFCLHLLAGPCL
jgi:hypothetical protein